MVIYAGGWVQVFYSQLNMRINAWYITDTKILGFYNTHGRILCGLSLPSKFHTHINNNFYSIRKYNKVS